MLLLSWPASHTTKLLFLLFVCLFVYLVCIYVEVIYVIWLQNDSVKYRVKDRHLNIVF